MIIYETMTLVAAQYFEFLAYENMSWQFVGDRQILLDIFQFLIFVGNRKYLDSLLTAKRLLERII